LLKSPTIAWSLSAPSATVTRVLLTSTFIPWNDVGRPPKRNSWYCGTPLIATFPSADAAWCDKAKPLTLPPPEMTVCTDVSMSSSMFPALYSITLSVTSPSKLFVA